MGRGASPCTSFGTTLRHDGVLHRLEQRTVLAGNILSRGDDSCGIAQIRNDSGVLHEPEGKGCQQPAPPITLFPGALITVVRQRLVDDVFEEMRNRQVAYFAELFSELLVAPIQAVNEAVVEDIEAEFIDHGLSPRSPPD